LTRRGDRDVGIVHVVREVVDAAGVRWKPEVGVGGPQHKRAIVPEEPNGEAELEHQVVPRHADLGVAKGHRVVGRHDQHDASRAQDQPLDGLKDVSAGGEVAVIPAGGRELAPSQLGLDRGGHVEALPGRKDRDIEGAVLLWRIHRTDPGTPEMLSLLVSNAWVLSAR